jgi:hypothetical protein
VRQKGRKILGNFASVWGWKRVGWINSVFIDKTGYKLRAGSVAVPTYITPDDTVVTLERPVLKRRELRRRF